MMRIFNRATAIAGGVLIAGAGLTIGTMALTRPYSVLTREALSSPEAYKEAVSKMPPSSMVPASKRAQVQVTETPVAVEAQQAVVQQPVTITNNGMPPVPRPRPPHAPASVAVAPVFQTSAVAVQPVYQAPAPVESKPDAAVLIDRFRQISQILQDVDPSVPWLSVFGRVRTAAFGKNPSLTPADAGCMMITYANLIRGSAYFAGYVPVTLQNDMNRLISGVERVPYAYSCRL